MLCKHFKRTNRSAKRLDTHLADFLFGKAKGYLWAERIRLDEYFHDAVTNAGGFIKVGTELRILFHQTVPFTVFKTEKYEFAFNRLMLDDQENPMDAVRKGNVFLFHNNQRVMTLSLLQSSSPLNKDNQHNHQVEDYIIHWSINNQWMSNYFDFMRRLDQSIMAIDKTPQFIPALNISINPAYELGYFVGKITRKIRQSFR
jgi:hypothetical protein